MSFLTPIFLTLALLAIPIILLYMLRLRRQEVIVSSTLLWQQFLRDREANAPWQKLKRNLLLFLQLLILLMLVLALARPFFPTDSLVTTNIVVLLDGSASMQANDLRPTRFDLAKEEVNNLIDELGGDNQMTIILVGNTPTVLASATNDTRILRSALTQAQADVSQADWPAAFALATGAAQGFRNAKIVLVSDGGLTGDLPPLTGEVNYIPVGVSGENLAISALATRTGETGIELFASVRNEGEQEQEALLNITIDGTLFDARRVTIPAQNSANVSWELPDETATIQATLEVDDFLPLDNVAYAVHEGGVSNRALLITEGNRFLEQVFAVLPAISSFKANPSDPIDPEGYDLFILDGVPVPDPIPSADMLIINPQPAPPQGLYNTTGIFSNTVATRLTDSPLLQFVDWRQVAIRKAQGVEAVWGQPLVSAEGGPLMLIGERNGYRIAMITFDLRDSDLPLQIAFPVLMANITSWLSPGRAFDAPTGLEPGDPVGLAVGASTTSVRITKPDNSQWQADVGEEELFFTETDQLGLYKIALRDSSGEREAGSFAVNLFNPNESNITPVASLTLGQVSVETEGEGDVGQREIWPWLVAIALLVLAFEWWVHHRGTPTIRWSIGND